MRFDLFLGIRFKFIYQRKRLWIILWIALPFRIFNYKMWHFCRILVPLILFIIMLRTSWKIYITPYEDSKNAGTGLVTWNTMVVTASGVETAFPIFQNCIIRLLFLQGSWKEWPFWPSLGGLPWPPLHLWLHGIPSLQSNIPWRRVWLQQAWRQGQQICLLRRYCFGNFALLPHLATLSRLPSATPDCRLLGSVDCS